MTLLNVFLFRSQSISSFYFDSLWPTVKDIPLLLRAESVEIRALDTLHDERNGSSARAGVRPYNVVFIFVGKHYYLRRRCGAKLFMI
jgi:hypothetical protein